MPQSWDMGQILLLPLRRKACWGFYARKIQRLRPGLNPQTWVPEDSMLTTRPPKPSCLYVNVYCTTAACLNPIAVNKYISKLALSGPMCCSVPRTNSTAEHRPDVLVRPSVQTPVPAPVLPNSKFFSGRTWQSCTCSFPNRSLYMAKLTLAPLTTVWLTLSGYVQNSRLLHNRSAKNSYTEYH